MSGVSRVRGSEFGDVITGNGGNNVLEGQGGNEFSSGFAGSDTLTGGSGADIFAYTNGSLTGGADIVTDFNPNEGDRIDLRRHSPRFRACDPGAWHRWAATPLLLLMAPARR